MWVIRYQNIFTISNLLLTLPRDDFKIGEETRFKLDFFKLHFFFIASFVVIRLYKSVYKYVSTVRCDYINSSELDLN